MPQFVDATKKQSYLRAAFFGPSGAGKTYTALRVATGIAQVTKGVVGLIDSENRTASKYAGKDGFKFKTLNLDDCSITGYLDAMTAAQEAGIGVLIIDSITHGWQELLESVEQISKARYRGNFWAAWSEGTPIQKKFIRAIQQYPGHLIVTMRSKTEWEQATEGRNKGKITRIGLAPEQGKGIEYEFDLLMEITAEHFGNVTKDRTGKFQDLSIEKPDEKFGKKLAEWLSEGEIDADAAAHALSTDAEAMELALEVAELAVALGKRVTRQGVMAAAVKEAEGDRAKLIKALKLKVKNGRAAVAQSKKK